MVKVPIERMDLRRSNHCDALIKVYNKGKIGEFYNIGSNKNLNNLEVTKNLLNISKKLISLGKNVKINFVKDRPGHDVRYALNSDKIKNLDGIQRQILKMD